MKPFSSFLIAAASADDSRGACTSILREKFKEYPVVGGEWDCSRTGKGRVACEVACDGAGILYHLGYGTDRYDEYRTRAPRLRLIDCAGESKRGQRIKENGLEGFSAENPIECFDIALGNCEAKAEEVLRNQTEIGEWNCSLSVKHKSYTCRLSCPSRTYLTPKVSAGFRFSNCHTKDPELSFFGMNDGDEFECLNCDQQMERLSEKVENGRFVRRRDRGRDRREANAYGGSYYGYGGGGKGGTGENFSTWYRLKCDDGRTEGTYKCANVGGSIYKHYPEGHEGHWTDQPCANN